MMSAYTACILNNKIYYLFVYTNVYDNIQLTIE